DRGAFFCSLLSPRPRRFATHFLIRVHLHDNLTPDGHLQIAQRPHPEDEASDTAFHVPNARSTQSDARLSKEHLRTDTQPAYRIGMRKHKNLPVFFFSGKRERESRVMTVSCST